MLALHNTHRGLQKKINNLNLFMKVKNVPSWMGVRAFPMASSVIVGYKFLSCYKSVALNFIDLPQASEVDPMTI